MRNKLYLTEELLSYLPTEDKVPIEQAMVTWWFNLREEGGLRLTNTGYTTLKKSIKLESYTIELNKPKVHTRLILALDRKLQWPYYLAKAKLDMFSSKEAMLAKLYPDLESFLKQYD